MHSTIILCISEVETMNEYLKAYIESIDYKAITEGAIRWIRDWFGKNGPDSPAVIGISGGKDSTVVAALCAEALGKDRVFGIMMPNGIQSDINVSKRVIEHLGIRAAEINIQEGYNGVMNGIRSAVYSGPDGSPLEISRQSQINLAPRIRMCVLYAASQCMNGRVSNNGNRSEKYVGYSTIFGDGAGDFSPLSNLTVTEVRIVGTELGLPAEFIQKPPSDGLSGKTDEDNLGFTYEALDTYILTGHIDDEKAKELIDRKHSANLFKTLPMPEYKF